MFFCPCGPMICIFFIKNPTATRRKIVSCNVRRVFIFICRLSHPACFLSQNPISLQCITSQKSQQDDVSQFCHAILLTFFKNLWYNLITVYRQYSLRCFAIYDKISRHNTIFPKHSVDFSGLAIFRHTITHYGSCAAFFMPALPV